MIQLSLMEVLANVPDPRDPRRTRHPLSAVLSLPVLAILAGCQSREAIAPFRPRARPRLGPCLGLCPDSAPHQSRPKQDLVSPRHRGLRSRSVPLDPRSPRRPLAGHRRRWPQRRERLSAALVGVDTGLLSHLSFDDISTTIERSLGAVLNLKQAESPSRRASECRGWHRDAPTGTSLAGRISHQER